MHLLFLMLLSFGSKPLLFEQARPSVPEPIYTSSLEQEYDEQMFQEMVTRLSHAHDLPKQHVEELLTNSLEEIQKELPFQQFPDLYHIKCLPLPTASFEVHKRIHLGDSELGVPIYFDVRAYNKSKEAVLEELFALIDGEFVAQKVSEGICYIGQGTATKERGHGFGTADRRRLFFHLIEKNETLFVAFVEASDSSRIFDVFLNEIIKGDLLGAKL